MPSDHINCPFCPKSVSRINLGAHILSREHLQQFAEQNKTVLETFYNRHVVEKKDFEKLLCAKAGKEYVRICLGCKRCYAYEGMRNEASTHFDNHPDCCERFRATLTTLCAPKEVVMTDPEALQKENDALKREIERLKKQPVITTPANIGMTDEALAEAEADAEKAWGQFRAYRDLMKELLGDKFPSNVDFADEIQMVKKFIVKPPSQPAVEPPKKMSLAKVEAYLTAYKEKDWDSFNELGEKLNTDEAEEAEKRIKALEPKPAPVPAPAPAPTFKPPPAAPQVLTSTRRGKVLDRERLGTQSQV